MSKILVINSGSSSLKCSLFSFSDELNLNQQSPQRLASGGVQRIGEGKTTLSLDIDDSTCEKECEVLDHAQALELFLETLVEEMNNLESLDDISAVGHRVVHGGESISKSVAVDDEVINAIEENADLAPLHNPPNLTGLKAAIDRLPGRLQVAVFDTAFHQSMPPEAYLYAIPYEMYEQRDVRRYGFHGTSHRYVAERAAQMLERPLTECNFITMHLGNGCSATAVRQGDSVDTSMGLTPLEGLVMGTRCGDIDPSLPYLLTQMTGMAPEEVYEMLNRESGLLGLSGISNDMREIIDSAKSDDEDSNRAEKALEVFSYYIKKYIGSYWTVLGDLDGIVFTAGIGENVPEVRRRACSGMESMGLRLDAGRNKGAIGTECVISHEESDVPVLVVPTDEELKIAMDTFEIYQKEN